jgi:hypothetical protein
MHAAMLWQCLRFSPVKQSGGNNTCTPRPDSHFNEIANPTEQLLFPSSTNKPWVARGPCVSTYHDGGGARPLVSSSLPLLHMSRLPSLCFRVFNRSDGALSLSSRPSVDELCVGCCDIPQARSRPPSPGRYQFYSAMDSGGWHSQRLGSQDVPTSIMRRR